MLLNGKVTNEACCREDEEVVIQGKSTEALPFTEQTQEQEKAWYDGANVP
jgi:hypothetical protein